MFAKLYPLWTADPFLRLLVHFLCRGTGFSLLQMILKLWHFQCLKHFQSAVLHYQIKSVQNRIVQKKCVIRYIVKRFHSYRSVICRRKASFLLLLLRDDVGGSDNVAELVGEPKRPFQQILHSIYGWAHLCIIKGTSYKVKNYRKTGMLPIPESLLLKKRTEMDDDSTKIHDNLVRHEKTYIQIPSHCITVFFFTPRRNSLFSYSHHTAHT